MRHRRTTTGEIISTLCFLGVGFWSVGVAAESSWPKATILSLCALACLAGAARHVLAKLLTGL